MKKMMDDLRNDKGAGLSLSGHRLSEIARSIEHNQLTKQHLVNQLKETLETAIKKYSTGVLGLKNSWDGQGSRGFSAQVWDRATTLLKKVLYPVWEAMIDVPIPSILPVPDGSLDLNWETPTFELLVNVPAEENGLVHLYGERVGSKEDEIEARINYDLVDSVIVPWLKKIL